MADGRDVTLLSYGFLVGETAAAAELLRQDGIQARVLNLRIAGAAGRRGGAAGRVRDPAAGDHRGPLRHRRAVHGSWPSCWCAPASPVPLHRLALEGRWFRPALLADVLEIEGFTAAHIAARVRRALADLRPQRGNA